MRSIKRSKISRKSKKRYTKRCRNILKITKKKKLSKKNVKKNYKKRYSQKNKKKMILSGGVSDLSVVTNPMYPIDGEETTVSKFFLMKKDLIGMGYSEKMVVDTFNEVLGEYPDLHKSRSGMEKFKKKILKEISDKYYKSGKLNHLPGAGASSSYGAIEDYIKAKELERGRSQNFKQFLGMEMRDDGTKRISFSRRNKDLTEKEKEHSRSIQERVKSEDRELRSIYDSKEYVRNKDLDIKEFMSSTGVSDRGMDDTYLRIADGNPHVLQMVTGERANHLKLRDLKLLNSNRYRDGKQQNLEMLRAIGDYRAASHYLNQHGTSDKFKYWVNQRKKSTAANKLKKFGLTGTEFSSDLSPIRL